MSADGNIWTPNGQRKLGAFSAVVAIVTLVIAVVTEPMSEWGFFAWVLGIALVAVALVGLYSLFTGKGSIRRRNFQLRRQRTLAIIALIGFSVALIALIASDLNTWTVVDTLSVGIWVGIAGMFIGQLVVVNRAISQSGTAPQ